MAVAAQLDIVSKPARGKGRRGTVRRELKLRARGAAASGATTDVLVRNLSATGLLIETAANLQVGDELEVDLPETSRSLAKVVWEGEGLFGCAFDRPLPDSAISAARLRSEPEVAKTRSRGELDHGSGDAPAEHWGQRLKRLRMEKGFSLVEFARQMNVSRPTVWSWEAGKSTPRPSKQQRMLKVLGVADIGSEPHADGAASRAPSELPARQSEPLSTLIDEAKERVAAAVGTSPDKIRLIIEV